MPACRVHPRPSYPALHRLLAGLLTLGILGGCSSLGGNGGDTDCKSAVDPLTGADYRWCGESRALTRETPMASDAPLLRLFPVQSTLGDTQSWFVRAQYQGQTWLYIAPRSDLQVTIDGASFTLNTPGGSRPDSTRQVRDRDGIGVQEAADYLTDAGMIRAIAMARIVDVRLDAGAGKTVETRLSGPELEPFRVFVRRYLDD
jgi:hypothetical protein